MADALTEQNLVDKIAAIDVAIAAIVTDLTAGGAGAASRTEYEIGQLRVKGAEQMAQLQDARKVYQDLLQTFPKEVTSDTPYEVDIDGEDQTELEGDE